MLELVYPNLTNGRFAALAQGAQFGFIGSVRVKFQILDMPVELALRLQVTGMAQRFQLAIVNHQNQVALANGGKPVWQEDQGSPLGDPFDRIIHQVPDRLVHRRMRLFDNQD